MERRNQAPGADGPRGGLGVISRRVFFKEATERRGGLRPQTAITLCSPPPPLAGEAQRQGVDPSTALTIWSAEGGVTNPAAQNPDSSATGISQHTAATWGDLGGTDQNRTDGKKQVELGVALTKQNSAALTKDLGRRPQPWEVYLAHQQGIGGATALLHADPNSNAAEVVGNPEAITLNGGTPDMSAGEFINTIKGYVDRHSMMYAANGVPTAQNLKENYEAGLQAVTDLARQEHPGDPAAEQRYRSHYIQQAGQQLHAENMTNQANWNILNAALNGPNAIKSEQDLMTNPRLVDAYNAILKTDPSAYRVVNNAINANASAVWDPPATVQTSRLYDNLNGMKDTDRPRFSDLNLMSYYGGMPAAQLNSLRDAQDRIRKNDPTEAAKHTDLISSISAVKDLTIQAAASIESPFYKMDLTSPFPPEQQKWIGFVSKFGQALDDWQQNNNNKIPTGMQKREIAQGILFPNGMPGQQTSTEIHDLTNKQRLDDTGKPNAPGDQSAPDQPAAQKKKFEDSWFWQTMESSGALKPYAERMREYVESPTDTKGAWDWLTSTVSKSGAQLSVGLARTPFDLAQTFSSGSQAAIEEFLKEHPEYEELAREDPTGQSLETLGAIGAGAGLLDVVEATAKGAAASIGKPLGIDTEKQTWSWGNFKDAWVNHPVESLVAVIPFGAAFLRRKGITPSETQVRELVDSAVKDEKTPLAQELKTEMEQGPPRGDLTS